MFQQKLMEANEGDADIRNAQGEFLDGVDLQEVDSRIYLSQEVNVHHSFQLETACRRADRWRNAIAPSTS